MLFAGGVTHTAPTSLNALSSIAGLRIFVFVLGIVFLGSAIACGFYLLLQLGSGRLMLGIRLIRTANMALRDISYTAMLPVVTCGALFLLGMYAYVVGKPLQLAQPKILSLDMEWVLEGQAVGRGKGGGAAGAYLVYKFMHVTNPACSNLSSEAFHLLGLLICFLP